MKKSFSYRIYPNKKQEVALNRTLVTCRHTVGTTGIKACLSSLSIDTMTQEAPML